MTHHKLSFGTLLMTLAVGAVFAPITHALHEELEDSDTSDAAPDDFKEYFTIDGRSYQAWGGLNLTVNDDGQAHVQAALTDSGAPEDLVISYSIRCAGTWEATTHISHDYDLVSDSFDINCHIPGQQVEAVRGKFYFGAGTE